MNLPKNMSLDQYASWLCLVEAFELINKNTVRYNKKPKLKPLAIREYIKNRKPSMVIEVIKRD